MERSPSDLENLARLAAALSREEPRINEIITLHVAVERELELVLEGMMRRPGHLRSIGHSNRIKVFRAISPQPDALVQRFADLLDEFNRLRNAVAHGDPSEVLDQHVEKMERLYKPLAPSPPGDLTVGLMAAGIFGLLAGLSGGAATDHPRERVRPKAMADR